MDASNVQINIPKDDLPLLRKMAKRMGWKIIAAKKSGIEMGLEDLAAGRVYSAANAEEMMAQILG